MEEDGDGGEVEGLEDILESLGRGGCLSGWSSVPCFESFGTFMKGPVGRGISTVYRYPAVLVGRKSCHNPQVYPLCLQGDKKQKRRQRTKGYRNSWFLCLFWVPPLTKETLTIQGCPALAQVPSHSRTLGQFQRDCSTDPYP